MRAFRFLPVAFLLAASVCFFGPTADAEAGNWTWKRYRLKFWLPTGMKATKNNRSSFIAKGKGIVLKIKPFRARRYTSKKAAYFGYNSYRIIKRKRILTTKRIRNKRGAWVYAIVGSGYYRRSKVYFAVIGINSKYSRNKFYVRAWWKKWRHRWVKARINSIAKSLRVY